MPVRKKPSAKMPKAPVGKFVQKRRDMECMKEKPDRDEVKLWVKDCPFARGKWVVGSVKTYETLKILGEYINEDAIQDAIVEEQIDDLWWSTEAGKTIPKDTRVKELVNDGIIQNGSRVILHCPARALALAKIQDK